MLTNPQPKTHRFLDIRLQKCRNLENDVRGSSRSLENHRAIECVSLPIDVLLQLALSVSFL